MKTAPQRSLQLEPGREADLVRAAQGGDPAAFTEIVRHFQRPIYRVAYALTRNASGSVRASRATRGSRASP